MYGNVTFREALRSVGRGWAPLIYQAYKNKPDDIKIIQVKEKFGGLRIYFEPSNPEYRGKIQILERLSYQMCEECGRRGKNSAFKGWIKTLCEECATIRNGRL